jgi:hypothetical protein
VPPTFNVFDKIIEPLGMSLLSDERFAGLKVFYDRTREKRCPVNLMPAINYFWLGRSVDTARGSGSYSLQTRTKTINIGFGVWSVSVQDAAVLDRDLWENTGNLTDFLYDHREFDRPQGVSVGDTIEAEPDYSNDENGIVGSCLVTCQFIIRIGHGRG